MSFLASAMTELDAEAVSAVGSDENEAYDFDDPGIQTSVALISNCSNRRKGDSSCSQSPRHFNDNEVHEQELKRSKIILIADIMDKARSKAQAGNHKQVSTPLNKSVNSSPMSKVKGKISFINPVTQILTPSTTNIIEDDETVLMPPQKDYVSPVEYEEKNTVDDGSLL